MRDSPEGQNSGTEPSLTEVELRPLTRLERRNLWLKEYAEQDVALQSWVNLVEQHRLEIEVMFQMHGILVFGVMVSTEAYARFYIRLHEDMYRQQDPETADFLYDYYAALVPPPDQPEIGQEGLPVIFRYVHLRDVTILSAGHQSKVPYWRGKINQIDAFVVGASPGK